MLQQGSDAWRQARCGSVGASDAPKVMRRVKSGGYSADRESLLATKVLEKLTGVPIEIPKTFAMLQGTEREPAARMTYSVIKGVEVEEVGLVPHPGIKGSHCSPDGLVGLDGLVELKCPQPAAHLDLLLNGQISNDYTVQMAWQLCCTGRAWCDFVSYSSDFPGPMQLFVKRVHADAKLIGELEREIAGFIGEIDRKVTELSPPLRGGSVSMARHGWALQGRASSGAAWRGGARHGLARPGGARHCMARHGAAGPCAARSGKAMRGKAMRGKA